MPAKGWMTLRLGPPLGLSDALSTQGCIRGLFLPLPPSLFLSYSLISLPGSFGAVLDDISSIFGISTEISPIIDIYATIHLTLLSIFFNFTYIRLNIKRNHQKNCKSCGTNRSRSYERNGVVCCWNLVAIRWKPKPGKRYHKRRDRSRNVTVTFHLLE